MRDRARAAIAVGLVVAALGMVGCDSVARTDSGLRSGPGGRVPVTVDSPTYLPAGLPGGFGAYPVRFTGRPGGYSVTARAHDTTYTIRVTTKQSGRTPLDPAHLATFETRTRLHPDGTVRWRDQVADVTISAAGPAGHTRQGLQAIGKRMVVVPTTVLDQFVGATRARRSRQVDLEPVRFNATSVPQTMYGRLGRASIMFTTARLKTGVNVCSICTPGSVFVIGGWRQDGTTFVLIGVPGATVVHPTRKVRIERQFDSMYGSDLVLLSTERSDHPKLLVTGPGGLRNHLAMEELKI